MMCDAVFHARVEREILCEMTLQYCAFVILLENLKTLLWYSLVNRKVFFDT